MVALISLTWRDAFTDAIHGRNMVTPSTRMVQHHTLAYDSREGGCPHYAHGATADIPVGTEDEPLLVQVGG
jgi:hypothetical protein